MTKPIVTIYTRPGCHLCHEARSAIESASCSEEYSLEEVNIDEDPVLREKYGYEIPVIFINGVKAFKHRIDVGEFKRKLRRLGRAEARQIAKTPRK